MCIFIGKLLGVRRTNRDCFQMDEYVGNIGYVLNICNEMNDIVSNKHCGHESELEYNHLLVVVLLIEELLTT